VLEIWLFGRVRFRADGREIVQVKPERAQRLLAWLALETRADAGESRLLPRRLAVHALWRHSGAARPENSLAQALRELRAVLGPAFAEHVVDDREVLGLVGDVWTDVARFGELASSDPAEALRLSDRPLLEFVIRSGSPWDHEQRAQIERARARAREAIGDRGPEPVPEPAPRRARPWWRARAMPVSVALTVAAVAAALALRQPGTEPASGLEPCRAGYVQPDPADARAAVADTRRERPRVRDELLVGIAPVTVATGREGIWVGDQRGVTLVEPGDDPARRPVIGVGDGRPSQGVFDIALARERIWVTRRDGRLVSIDRATRRVVGAPIRYGSGPGDVAIAGASVWVNNYADDYDGSVTLIDPCTRRVRSRVAVGRSANTVVPAFGSLWVSDPVDRAVKRLDPRTARVQASVEGVKDPEDLAPVGDELWVVQYNDQSVVRIDPAANRVVGDPIRVGPDPAGIAVAGDAVWIPLYGNGTLTRIDRRTLTAKLGAVATRQTPTDVAVGFGRLWTPDNSGDSVAVIAP